MTGETYAHEQISVPPGRSAEYLEIVRQEAVPVYQEFGWELAGAWETIMIDDSECFFLWAIPTWEQWAEFEKAQRTHPALLKWRASGLRGDHVHLPLPPGGRAAQPVPHPSPARPLGPHRLGGMSRPPPDAPEPSGRRGIMSHKGGKKMTKMRSGGGR